MSKRGFDFFFSALGLIFVLPLFLPIAFLIKIDSPGPVFFRQIRVGRYLRPFKIYKFRTMHACISETGPSVSIAADPRVTRVGKVLRKYKLDELPQLMNVLVGDMSLVGPRPEVPKYVSAYDEKDKRIVYTVRPGITDEASIAFRNESELLVKENDIDEFYVKKIIPIKLAYHRKYVGTHSLWLDFKIVLKTIWIILPFNSHK